MQNKKLFLILIIILLISLACSLSGTEAVETHSVSTEVPLLITNTSTISPIETKAPDPSHTPTVTISPTPSITPVPAFVEDWDNYSINILCLDVQLDYPQFEDPIDEPIVELMNVYLSRMGIATVLPGNDCDASLTIELTITSESSIYVENNIEKTCYSGSKTLGNMTLSSNGKKDLTYKINESLTPDIIMYCHSLPHSAANFSETWVPGVVTGLIKFWELPAALIVLEPTGYIACDSQAKDTALLLAAEYQDGNEILLPYLIPIIEKGGIIDLQMNPDLLGAINLISDMGPAAIEAVPYLINAMEQEIDSGIPISSEWGYAATLEAITGQEATIDPDFWWDWWEENQP